MDTSFNKKHRTQEKNITVPKKPLFWVFSYLASLSLQTRTKLRKPLKGILTCCKLHIMFIKNKNKLNPFKDDIPNELNMLLFVNFNVDSCSESYYIDYVRNLNVKI